MKKYTQSKIKEVATILLLAVLCFAYLAPSLTLAQTAKASGNTGNSGASATGNTRGSGPKIENPLGQTGSLSTLVAKILHLVFEIGAIVVVFFIIYAGFKMVIAQGEPKAITDAKNMLLYTVIGAVILLGAETISQVISNTVQQLAK